MNTDINKTIIRIIHDYCVENSATFSMDKLAITLAPRIAALLRAGELTPGYLHKEALKRKDFFVGNDLKSNSFCYGLFKKLNSELSFYKPETLFEAIVRFKRKMENGNFRGFSKATTSEDTLRCVLNLFIQEETFMEARAASGQSDICIPSEKVVIETKLWGGIEYYESGLPELCDYLDKNNYTEGYYVIFDYNQSENQLEKDRGHIFDIPYNGHRIHVFFIRMNDIPPSKKYRAAKEKS